MECVGYSDRGEDAPVHLGVGVCGELRYCCGMASEEERGMVRRQKPVSGSVEDYEQADDDAEGPSADDIARFSDVTVKCPGCGTELFDDVRECWKCRRSVDSRNLHETGLPTWVVLTAVALLLLVIGYFVL